MGHGSIPECLDIALLCKRLGWTYTEYMDQPRWFTEVMAGVVRIDIIEENKRAKKANQKHG